MCTLPAACEDLQQPGGAIALVSSAGHTEWFSKGYSVFGSAHDDQYYLNMSKQSVTKNAADVLAVALLNNYSSLTWELVASAIPVIRGTGGARAFVGSRGSSVDTTFNDNGEDAAGYGFPPPLSYVFNLTNQAGGGEYLKTGKGAPPYLNHSGMAEGLVGGELPIVVFYYTVTDHSSYLPPSSSGYRYWTMVAAGTVVQPFIRAVMVLCSCTVVQSLTKPNHLWVREPRRGHCDRALRYSLSRRLP